MFRDTVRLSSFIVCFASFALISSAQQTPPQTPADQQQPPVQPAPPAQTAPSSATPAPVAQATRPPEEPNVLEDGGWSIEPMYWLTRAQPGLKGGADAADSDSGFQNLDYPGNSNNGLGVEASIPTGHSNTLRVSYFRVQGNANTPSVGTNGLFLYGEQYAAGDYLVQNYNVQIAKISWDYLSYTWRRKPGNIHFKTLYEVQYVNFGTNVYAPFVPVTVDTSGNTDTNSSAGSQSVILPTLGGELEQEINGRLRWEVKASGFGIPHHAVIWDGQADIALRVSKFELIAGEKGYHFKSSPQGNEYVSDTLQGIFVGVRYYLGSLHR